MPRKSNHSCTSSSRIVPARSKVFSSLYFVNRSLPLGSVDHITKIYFLMLLVHFPCHRRIATIFFSVINFTTSSCGHFLLRQPHKFLLSLNCCNVKSYLGPKYKLSPLRPETSVLCVSSKDYIINAAIAVQYYLVP